MVYIGHFWDIGDDFWLGQTMFPTFVESMEPGFWTERKVAAKYCNLTNVAIEQWTHIEIWAYLSIKLCDISAVIKTQVQGDQMPS